MADETAKAAPTPTPNRSELRSKVFGHKAESRLIEAFGIDIELRAPSVRALIEATSPREGESREDATSRASVMAIISHCYVPGTNEKLFSEADAEELMKLPMDAEYRKLQEAISEIMGIKAATVAQTKN